MKPETQETLLLEGLAKSDSKAIETIYKENYNLVQSLIVNNSGTTDDAKDIFQEAIVVLYEKVKSGGFELNCQLKTYIYSVSRRLWLKKLAQQQSRFPLSDHHEDLSIVVEDDIEEHEQRDMEFKTMDQAIQQIGEPCKSLLEAFYMQKKTMQEIAYNFGYTNADNAKTQKYKCLTRLKKLFFTQYKNDSL